MAIKNSSGSYVYKKPKWYGNLLSTFIGACLVFGNGMGCSSSREANETTDAPVGTIQTDEQRQQIYNQAGGVDRANENPIPKPTNINEKASTVNNKKNIEAPGTDKPSLTPTEVRPQLIKPRTDTVPR
jgi:hypothetical protein